AHPQWVLDRLEAWPRDDARTAWIVRRALRTLVKAGHPRALALIGAGSKARVRVRRFEVGPARLRLGERLTLALELVSTARAGQRLVVDYAIHYVRRSGTRAKVFKWKEVTLAPGERILLTRSQQIRDFSTRRHHPGRHVVEALVNGARVAAAAFHIV